MTSAGMILWTAAYMSPEQARGLAVDKRADIWAFGCILFEMLTESLPFEGRDVTEVLASAIHAEPDLATLPRSTPPRIRELIVRCLRKDPRSRLRDIGDARTVLEDVELGPYLADDGTTALLNLGGDVYSIDVERGTRQKLADSAQFPIFTPDDRFATFRQSPRAATPAGGIVKTPAVVDGSPESLVEDKDAVLSVQSNLRTARSTVPASWNPRTGRFSPDGNWLAYVSDETGEYQVYVVPYPGPGPKPAVSIDGGLSPIWSPDGSELFEGPYTLDFMGHQRWDVAPDGARLLMVENSQDYRIVIVQNWSEELERLAPTKR